MRRALPHLHDRLIARPRLLALPGNESAQSVLLITAPAGYGKTTLGAMWLRHRAGAAGSDAGRILLWLTCTNEANDPVSIARDIIQTIAVHIPSLGSTLAAMRSMPGAAVQLFESSIRSVGGSPRTILLALDDLHLIHTADALHIVQLLIDAASPNLQLLLLSRTLPELRLPATMLHLSADDLRFDHAEFLRFAQASARLADLDHASLTALEQRAAGWVTALQLFTIAPESSLQRLEPQEALPLRRDFVNEYFERFVLHDLAEPLHRFLLRTAPLPAFDAPLAAEALEITVEESAALIDGTLNASLFLQEYDGANESCTYAYHPLFREFLEQRFLEECGRPAFDAHLTRLGDLFAATGDEDEALDLYLRAGSTPRALELLAAQIRSAMRNGNTVPALRWLARFTDEQIESVPALALDAAWLAQIVGDASRRPALERAQRALACSVAEADQHTALLTLQALTAYFEGRAADARRFTDEACAAPTPSDPLVAGYRLSARALSPLESNDWQARVEILGMATDQFRRADFPYGMIFASAMRAAMQRRFADGAGTLHSLAMLMRDLGDRLDTYSGSALDARAVYAETLYMVDQLEEAQRLFRMVLDTHIRLPEMELSLQKAAVYLDSIQALGGSPPFLDAAADLATWQRALAALSPIAVGALAHQRVIRDFQRGDLNASRAMLDAAGITRTSTVDIARLAALTFDVLSGSTDPAVGDALAEMLAASRTPAGRLALMRIAAPYAIFLDAVGRPTEAERLMREILPLVRESRMHRLVLDYAPIGAILKRILDPFAQRLFVRLHSHEAPFDLSRAELRVLLLAASGLRRREIAQRIDRQPITVGRHLVNAYRKLGVHTRADALRILRETGVME